jgi:hypothetical protein
VLCVLGPIFALSCLSQPALEESPFFSSLREVRPLPSAASRHEIAGGYETERPESNGLDQGRRRVVRFGAQLRTAQEPSGGFSP